MYLYLEESGEPGPSARRSMSQHFVLVALVVPDRERVAESIQRLRQRLNFFLEFRSNTPHRYQIALLRLAVSLGISVGVVVVDKKRLSQRWQRRSGLALYRAVAETLLPEVTVGVKRAILVADEVSPKQTAMIKRVVRRKVNPRKPSKENPRRIKKIRGANSKSDDLLQLAHVVAWSVFRSRERGDDRFLKVVKPVISWYQFRG